MTQTVIKIKMKYSVILIKRPKSHKQNESTKYIVSELEDKIKELYHLVKENKMLKLINGTCKTFGALRKV